MNILCLGWIGLDPTRSNIFNINQLFEQPQMNPPILQFPCNQDCLICGNSRCEESYDHQKATLQDINSLLLQNKQESEHRNSLISQVHEFYDYLLEDITAAICKDRQEILQMLRKADYSYLRSDRKVSMQLVGELACQNYSSLPSKRLINIIEALENRGNRSLKRLEQTQMETQNESIVKEYISVDNFMKLVSEFKSTLLTPILNFQTEVKLESSRKVSIRECQNPEEFIIANQDPIQVTIKGRVISDQSVMAEINNRNITDNDIVSSINELKKFKSLTKIEIRNNRITSLTSKMIAFNLPALTKLDIRGNNLGEQGVLVLAQNLKNLREFYICENKVTDAVVEQIFKNMKELTMLWMQNNEISLSAATLIITLENLRAVALHGNLFSEDQGQCLKTNFLGYINV